MYRFIQAALLSFTLAAAAQAQVVISQVNGNGGLGTSVDPFDRDFVELFNKGTTPVNMAGWSIQIFADNGTSTTPATPAWDVIPISGTIYPGQYFLIAPSFQRGSQGASVTTSPLPAPDVMGPVYDGAILVSGSNAVALMSTTTPIPAGQCPSGPNLIDLFRVGLSNCACFEGSGPAGPPSPGTSTQGAAFRTNDGCDDSNNSISDIITQQFPVPRNSDSNVFVTTTILPNMVDNGTGGAVTITAFTGASLCNPITGPLTSATANLSAFGLSASQALFDDGAHNDGGAGDGVFGYTFNVSPAQAVGTYVIPMTGTSGATTLASSARLRVFPAPATNDLCANAIDLNGVGIDIVNNGPYSTKVNTTLASGDGIDAGTCNGDAEAKFSVWYTFTAPTSGALRITESSTEDVVYSIHASCGSASSQCINREDGGFPMTAGNTYWIQIGRETGSTVPPQVYLELVFQWLPTNTAVPNDLPCGAQTIAAFPFSAQPYAPAAADESATFNISCDAAANVGARNGVWYTFVAPSNGALLTFENSINPTNFTLFTGADCNSLGTPGDCKDESFSLGALHNGLIGGTTYWLLVSYDAAPSSSTSSQPYDFSIDFIPQPTNDLCANAVNLNSVGLPYAEVVRARAATNDTGVPTTTGGTGVNTCTATLGTRPNGVWYTYTSGSEETGTLRVADFSTQDVFYNVFNACGGAAVQCYGAFTNDDIFIQLSPNTTYYILVGMQTTTATASGDYSLTFTLFPRPANDEPCGATEVTSSFNDLVAGPAALPDVDVSCNYTIPVQTTTGYGVWYHFNLPTAQQVRIHQSASDVLVYGLFTGPGCETLSQIDCKMGSNGALTTDNTAYFNLMPNTDYWLLIGKISNSQPFGFYDLSFTLTDAKGACCNGSLCTIATAATCVGSFVGPFTYCGETPNYEDTVPAAIPEVSGGSPGVLTKTINVPDSGTISDLKVLVDLNHARVGDLIITIQGPGGGLSDLIRRIDDTDAGCPAFESQGRLTDLGGVYIFDDQSYNPYGPSMPPAAKYFDFTGLVVLPGHYKPTQCNDVVIDLNSAFVGQTITGDWTLTITDNDTGSTGTLNRWGLIINYGANPPCCRGDASGNGEVNGLDVQPFVNCLLTGSGGNCGCADFSGNGSVGTEDIAPFITRLLGS